MTVCWLGAVIVALFLELPSEVGYSRQPSEIPRSSSQSPEVGLVTIQDGSTSRKYCKSQEFLDDADGGAVDDDVGRGFLG